MKVIAMPGLAVPKAYLQPSFYTKWGKFEASNEINIPASLASGEGFVSAKPVCQQYKVVSCRPRANRIVAQKCFVQKQARLVQVNMAAVHSKPWFIARCSAGDGAFRVGRHFCTKVSEGKFAAWVSLKNVHEVCDLFLKLL